MINPAPKKDINLQPQTVPWINLNQLKILILSININLHKNKITYKTSPRKNINSPRSINPPLNDNLIYK